MTDIILLPSIQHTGKWFLISILEDAGYKVIPFNKDWRDPGYVLCVHFPQGNGVLPEEKKKHGAYEDIREFIKMREGVKVIVPIRDILASLITRQQRHPANGHEYIVDGFLLLAKRFDELSPFYFPVDMPDGQGDRTSILVRLEKEIDQTIKHKCTIAKEWKPQNSQGAYELKEKYYGGDIEYIKSVIPEDWEYLMQNRAVIQPFFEGLGYRELLWYKEKSDGLFGDWNKGVFA